MLNERQAGRPAATRYSCLHGTHSLACACSNGVVVRGGRQAKLGRAMAMACRLVDTPARMRSQCQGCAAARIQQQAGMKAGTHVPLSGILSRSFYKSHGSPAARSQVCA